MPIRLSGLASGLDTEALVGALVSAYSYKKEKYTKAQTKLSWKQDAWKTLNSKVYSLYTEVGNMRYSSNYAIKKATVSDTTKATATASGNAINGTQSLEVKKLSTSAYVTGGKLADSIKMDSNLSELGIVSGTTDKGAITVRTGTKVTKIELDMTMTVNQLVSKFKEAGLDANYDEKNNRFFISAQKSGKDGDFSISADNTKGLSDLMKLGLLSDSEIKSIKSTVSTEGLVKRKYGSVVSDADGFASLIRAVKGYKDIINSSTASDEEKQEASDAINAEPSYREIAEYLDGKNVDWSTLTESDIVAYGKEIYNAGKYDDDAAAATEREMTASLNAIRDEYVKLSAAKAMPETTDAEKAAKNAAIAKAKADVDAVLENPVNAKWASYIEKNFGAANDGSFEDDKYRYSDFWTQSDNLELANSVSYRMKLAYTLSADAAALDNANAAVKIDGSDSEIILNGVTYKGSTNSITVNGLTIEAKALTAEKSPISITVSTDTDSLYDKVKDFLTSYNTLMNEMQKLYNADSAKDYEPLTDDEKNEMSETEIEKWEQKIKDSLLRRDNSLSGLISTMTMSMMKSYTINGESVSWSTFGIHTLGTLNSAKNENYAYHIDGDTEDSKTSGNPEKLRAALAEDPEKVIEFLKQMTKGLYEDLDKKMKSTSVKSMYTVYNDKEMASEYSNYNNLIKTWTDRVTEMEDSYYKKFAQMEKALSQLQSNSSSITSLLGG